MVGGVEHGRSAGFTLIEVLIAVAVLAVLATGAGLAVSRGATRTASDAQTLQHVFLRERGLAIQGRSWRGVAVEPLGYRLARVSEGQWTLSDTRVSWRGRASTLLDGPAVLPGAHVIAFLPNGRTSAGHIDFTSRGGSAVRCTFDGWTGVTCDEG